MQSLIEPDVFLNFSFNQFKYYLALITTITLDCINMCLLTKQLTEENSEEDTLQKSIYTLGCMYAFCVFTTLATLFVTSIFWYPKNQYYNIWIYLYFLLYAANTLIYIYICKKYNPVIFTLSGVLSIVWSIFLDLDLVTIPNCLACLCIFVIMLIYVQVSYEKNQEISKNVYTQTNTQIEIFDNFA